MSEQDKKHLLATIYVAISVVVLIVVIGQIGSYIERFMIIMLGVYAWWSYWGHVKQIYHSPNLRLPIKSFFIVASTMAVIALSLILVGVHIAFNDPTIRPQILDMIEMFENRDSA